MVKLLIPFSTSIERYSQLKDAQLEGELELGNPKSESVFVIVHGFLDTHRGSLATSISKRMVLGGYNCFRFTFRDPRDGEGMFTYGGHFLWIEQILAVVNWLEKEKKMAVRGIIGHSKGASVALMCSEKLKIDYIVSIGSRTDLSKMSIPAERVQEVRDKGISQWPNKLKTTSYITREDLEDRCSIDLQKIMADSVNTNVKEVLSIVGSDDSMVSAADCEVFERLIHRHTLVVIEDCRHSMKFHEEEVGDHIVRFLRDRMGGTRDD